MQHFANFGIIKQANKQLKRMYEAKQNHKGYSNGKSYSQSLTSDMQDSFQYGKTISRTRRVENEQRAEDARTLKIKPALLAKKEVLEFKPTTQQLTNTLNKEYPDYKDYVNHPKDLLVSGSENHTWLTNDGKYMEMPIGQHEMPLNSSMWKGRLSGKRLPESEIKGSGITGSPVESLGSDILKEKSKKYSRMMKEPRTIGTENLGGLLTSKNDIYNNQIVNKRYVPEE